MEQPKYRKNKELECYERVLNGIIAVNIGAASIPLDELSLWGGFLNAWAQFQKENRNGITRMIRQFGRDERCSSNKKHKPEGR